MTKNLLVLFICLVFNTIYCQEIDLVRGFVTFNNVPLEKVNVINISNNKYAITDIKGIFYLNAKADDSLQFTFIGYQTITKVLTHNDIFSKNLLIVMKTNSTKLDEVVITNNSKITAFSLGIIQKKITPLSTNERRLKTAGDFKPIHLLNLLGGSLPLDPILNSLNGKTKNLKKNIEIEKKEASRTYLKLNYEEYIKTTLKLKNNDDLNRFYYFVVDRKDLLENIIAKNDLLIKFSLSGAITDFTNTKQH